MATTARHEPFIWCSWLAGLLAGEKHCWWAAWFKAHYKFDKVARDFDLVAWTAEHTDLVIARARELEGDGWTVYLEDQNKFFLRGQAATLSGKCDLVAVKGELAKLIDCKSGKPKDADFHQVLLYLLALPMFHPAVAGKRLVGELQYRTDRKEIQPEEFTPVLRARIVAAIKSIGTGGPPTKVPSANECAHCDIGPADCPQRVATPQAEVLASEW